MPLEYLSGNELLKYPFKDNTSQISNNNVELPTSVFADIIVALKTSDITAVSIDQINRPDSTTASIRFNYTGHAPNTLTFDITDAAKHELLSFDLTHVAIRLVPGSGFIDFFQSLPIATVQSYDLAFDDAAVFLHVPRVKQVAFYNLDELEAVVQGSELVENELLLAGGNNVSLVSEKNKLVAAVVVGAGAGLYNPCGNDLVIKSINNTPGDPLYKNFTLLADGCYTMERGDGVVNDFGLQIANVCTPKCTAEQLSAFAHYLNRVKDGMSDIANNASSIYDDLQTAIEDYKTTVLPTLLAPFIKSAITSYDDGYGHTLRSIVVGFFSRDGNIVTAAASVTGGTFVSAHYKSGDYTHKLLTASCSETLDCLTYGRFELVLKGAGPFVVTASAGDTTYTTTYT